MVACAMAESLKPASSEREATDQSLVVERGKTDDELAKGRVDLEGATHDAVTDARGLADDAVNRARAKADEELRRAGADAHEQAAVEKERAREDDASREGRASADEKAASESDARRQALQALLAFEREHTDEQLLFERERADDALASRDDFLAMVSHDLRNMLGGVAMSAASLMKIPCDGEVRDDVGRHAQRIQRFTARMNRLVGDLLDIVSIEAGRLAVVPKEHDVNDLLRETLELFRPMAAAKEISIQTDERGGSLRARYDHGRILQVLANLVGNALKFTQKGGRIELAVEAAEDELRFSVADTGSGIAHDKLEAVFERFWQVAQRERSGLGLGLYISRCIVEAHGGRIWVDSRLGEGSTFHFTLPGPAAASKADVSGP